MVEMSGYGRRVGVVGRRTSSGTPPGECPGPSVSRSSGRTWCIYDRRPTGPAFCISGTGSATFWYTAVSRSFSPKSFTGSWDNLSATRCLRPPVPPGCRRREVGVDVGL